MEQPVTQDIQTESWEVERDTEICSGSKPRTRRRTRGSVSGKSTATPRKAGSNGTVTGSKGPSRVDGIWQWPKPASRISRRIGARWNWRREKVIDAIGESKRGTWFCVCWNGWIWLRVRKVKRSGEYGISWNWNWDWDWQCKSTEPFAVGTSRGSFNFILSFF